MERRLPFAHSLFAFERELVEIDGWLDWLKLWHQAATWQQLIGLLHCGFEVVVREDERREMICFYLKVAEGYRSQDHLAKLFPDDKITGDAWFRPSNQPYFSQRWQVAQKAWKMLCDKIFKNTGKDHNPSWLRYVCNQRVFSDLLWFFRAPEHNYAETNLPHWRGDDNHQDTVARTFLKDFLRLVWRGTEIYTDHFLRGWTYNTREEQAEQADEMFRAARPGTLDLLVYLDWEELLLKSDFRGPIENLAPECWQRLEELALRKDRGKRGEPCSSVENALVNGSTMAGVVILLRAKYKEVMRLKAIKEAEEAKAEAEKRLARLSHGS